MLQKYLKNVIEPNKFDVEAKAITFSEQEYKSLFSIYMKKVTNMRTMKVTTMMMRRGVTVLN